MHCPLTKSTKHMINKETLSLMKPSAFIVNSSRGALIDKTAAGFDSGWQYKEIYGGKSNECRIKSIVSDEINMDGISWQELNNCVKEKRECYIMINLEKLQNALVEYKKIFDEDGRGKNINGKRWNGFRIIGTSMRMTLQICLLRQLRKLLIYWHLWTIFQEKWWFSTHRMMQKQ